MDEDDWTNIAPWRKVPMFCGSRPPTKHKIESDTDRWIKQRDRRNQVNSTQSAEQGYPKPFKKNTRKIGFRN